MLRQLVLAVLLCGSTGLSALAEDAGYLGVVLGKLPEGVEAPRGALIQDIFEASPADRDGLRTGDLVIAANDREVSEVQGLLDALQSLKSGDRVALKIRRAGEKEPLEMAVTLDKRPAGPLNMLTLKKRPSLGIVFAMEGDGRLSISSFLPDSAAEQAQLQAGDVITSIAGHEVKGYVTILSLIAGQKPGEQVKIQVSRNGQPEEVTVTLKEVAPKVGT